MSDKVELNWENPDKLNPCNFNCKECENRCEDDKSIFGWDESKKVVDKE